MYLWWCLGPYLCGVCCKCRQCCAKRLTGTCRAISGPSGVPFVGSSKIVPSCRDAVFENALSCAGTEVRGHPWPPSKQSPQFSQFNNKAGSSEMWMLSIIYDLLHRRRWDSDYITFSEELLVWQTDNRKWWEKISFYKHSWIFLLQHLTISHIIIWFILF